MNFQANLSEIASVLSQIQSDPALFSAALHECEQLYVETFVYPQAHTAKELIEKYEESRDDLAICLYNFTRDMEKAFEASEDKDPKSVYKQYIKLKNEEQEREMQEQEFLRNCSEDEYDRYLSYDDMWDEDLEIDRYMPEILKLLPETEFVMACNYKGEPEYWMPKAATLHLRKFISRHNYI